MRRLKAQPKLMEMAEAAQYVLSGLPDLPKLSLRDERSATHRLPILYRSHQGSVDSISVVLLQISIQMYCFSAAAGIHSMQSKGEQVEAHACQL